MLDDTETRYLEANGLRFAYQSHGEMGGPAIVLIRGLGTQMIEWSPLLIDTLIEAGLRVVIFDNRDAGLSSRMTEDYALADMAADVVALMKALGEQSFHVFGISLGGMIAQLVAALHGDSVRCLFSVMSTSGNPDLPVATKAVRIRLQSTAPDRAGRIALDAENRAVWGSPGYPETEAERLEMATRTYDRCHFPEGVSRQMLAAIEDGSRVQRLAGIRARTLVIHGADDPLILPACGEDTARVIPGAEFQLIPGMGHNIPHALAPEIGTRILAFIDSD